MDNYNIICRLGGGSFADVYKAIEKKTGEYVAIKILKKKYSNWEECLELREAKSLKKLQEDGRNSTHKGIENIIKLKEMIFIKETGVLNLIFEYMEKDLFELMKQRANNKFTENQIRSIIYQILSGLSFMHKYGYFHRDLKPENILISGDKVKIADFGLAREIRSIPPYTEYVSTRYYRAPECILKSSNYNSPVDIWALGCVMAELYLHPQPLFCGNNEKEVLFKICSLLSTPNHTTWPEGIQLAKKYEIKFPNCNGTKLSNIITNASSDAIDIMYQMINWDPNKRATANSLLLHPFFTNYSINARFNGLDISGVDLSVLKKDDSIINSNLNSNNCNCNPLSNNENMISDLSNEDETKRTIGIKGYNGSKLRIKTKEDLPIQKKDEDINFSKILNDTEGFDNLINKLKNEKYDVDLDIEQNKNLFGSPINADKDFDFDGFKEGGPQNTLFFGSSGNFKESSILNKNITNLGQSKNDTIYDYSNGNKFFDNSVVGNINSGITMTSMAPGLGDHLLTGNSMDNQSPKNKNLNDQSGNNINLFNSNNLLMSDSKNQIIANNQSLSIIGHINDEDKKNSNINESSIIPNNMYSHNNNNSDICCNINNNTNNSNSNININSNNNSNSNNAVNSNSNNSNNGSIKITNEEKNEVKNEDNKEVKNEIKNEELKINPTNEEKIVGRTDNNTINNVNVSVNLNINNNNNNISSKVTISPTTQITDQEINEKFQLLMKDNNHYVINLNNNPPHPNKNNNILLNPITSQADLFLNRNKGSKNDKTKSNHSHLTGNLTLNAPKILDKKDDCLSINSNTLLDSNNPNHKKTNIKGNRRRSAKRFIEESEKEGDNYMNKKEEKDFILPPAYPQNNVNVFNINKINCNIPMGQNNKFNFNNKDFSSIINNGGGHKLEFPSRRAKNSNINVTCGYDKDSEFKGNPTINLNKLLENNAGGGNSNINNNDIKNSPVNNNRKTPNSNNGFLFGIESRRGRQLLKGIQKK